MHEKRNGFAQHLWCPHLKKIKEMKHQSIDQTGNGFDTCQKDTTWHYQNQPKCVLGKLSSEVTSGRVISKSLRKSKPAALQVRHERQVATGWGSRMARVKTCRNSQAPWVQSHLCIIAFSSLFMLHHAKMFLRSNMFFPTKVANLLDRIRLHLSSWCLCLLKDRRWDALNGMQGRCSTL